MKILACPGQGSQSAGFLSPWISDVVGFAEKLQELSDFCELDLIALGTNADEETIRATQVAQPLIVAASIAAARTAVNLDEFDGVIGHSVGEFAASAIAGVISDEEAMRLVGVRGGAMADAAGAQQTSMAAVIGTDEAEITRAVAEKGLVIANFNGAGQYVAAGLSSSISELVISPPAGTRVVQLKVAGAFHTSFMAEAVEELSKIASAITAKDPKIKLWSNVDGAPVQSGEVMLRSLVSQVANPVRWDLCMQNLAGIEMFVELPPAGALAGLAKRGISSAQVIALKTPQDLEKIGQ